MDFERFSPVPRRIEIAGRPVEIWRPPDMEALAQVSGIGAAKLERYGEAVLTVVRAA